MSIFFEAEELFELRSSFILSAKEKVEAIEALILSAERQKNFENNGGILREILGHTHTIKGSSRVFKFDAIVLICHKLEDYISTILDHNKIISAEELTKMLRHIDLLRAYIKEFNDKKTVDDKFYQEEYTRQFLTFSPPAGVNLQATAGITQIPMMYILVVGINRTIMKQVYLGLEDINYHLSFANDALDALHRLSLEKFDLIISSYIMDPINGVTFSLAVKAQWSKKAPKIVLLVSEEIETGKGSGKIPDEIFLKSPALPQDIKKYLEADFSNFVKKQPAAVKGENRAIKSIFFVEDEQHILDLFSMAFRANKNLVLYKEITTTDPYQRILAVKPDLIICDIHVPNVDVVGLFIKIKSTESLRKTPIVFFTGDLRQPLAQVLTQLGALAIMDKTIILSSMFEELANLGLQLEFKK